MGINLKDLVQSKEIKIEDLAGRMIGIDGYNILYQFLSTIRDRFTGEPLRNSKGEITSHLSGLFYRTVKIVEAGIQPVYVFDGKPPEFKKKLIEERIKIRENAKDRWEEALKKGDVEEVRIASQGAVRLTSDMVDTAKKLLTAMGVAWIQAPSEGEAQLAVMASKGEIWASGSQDWDSLLFGAKRLVRNLTITGRRKVPRRERYVIVNPEIIELESFLSNLGITRDQLILLGMLVGTDYNSGGIKGIGPKNALKIVKEEKTLENVLKKVKWEFDVPAEIIFEFFKTPPYVDTKIEKEKLDMDKLRKLLVDENDFLEERVDSTLQKLQKKNDENKQSSLGKFFGK
ncbi:MAG: flap endonuclease-1 [Candidatus Aenigmatarchaeota archaeon]|nr:flap endonuclease-1 [Nanoarchaeota archaeon]